MKYQIQVIYNHHERWLNCVKAAELPNGWLNYQLRNGATGIIRPGAWRISRKGGSNELPLSPGAFYYPKRFSTPK